jgi:prepilin-type N-terminal cleavage/methylation domain-containing protein
MSRVNLIRDERGFSLVELLMAMALGSLVLTATMVVFTNGLAASGRIGDRIDSASRGRTAMDAITTLLDSQVCLRNNGESTLQPAVPPVIGASSTGTSISFYADLSGASDTPNRYTITYDATAKTLTQSTYKGTGTLGTAAGVTFATTPTVRRLADNVEAVTTSSVVQPIFTYYVFTTGGTVDTNSPVTPSATNQLKIVRVGVQFQANSSRTKTSDARRTVLNGEGIVATADPTDALLTACAA